MYQLSKIRPALPAMPGFKPLWLAAALLVAAAAAFMSSAQERPGAQANRDTAIQNDGGGSVGIPRELQASAPGPKAEQSADASVSALTLPDMSAESRIVQTGTIELRVRRGQLQQTYDRASALVIGLGGHVASSSFGSSVAAGAEPDVELQPSGGLATLTLRVPARSFTVAGARLAKLGKVQSRQVQSQDVTQEAVDVESRLRHHRAVEARLLALLAKTTTVSEALVIQDRLDGVQQNIELEQGRLNYLKSMTAMSTLTLTINERGAAASDSTRWGTGTAFGEAAHRFVESVNGGIVGLGAHLPLLLIVLLAFGAVRYAILRRRA